MPGERARDNKTLTAACAACGKEAATDLMVGLVGGEPRAPKTFAVCRACYEKGWRPPGYRGY